MAQSSPGSRERARVIDAGIRRRIRESVAAASRLGDRLARAVYHHRGSSQDVQALVDAWRDSLRTQLIDAAERSHRRAWLDGVQEAAQAMVARDRRAALLARSADPTARAVEFLRKRVRATPENVAALRESYGRLATDIVLPLGATAGRELHETLADIVRSNASRANAQEMIRQSLDGVTAARPYVIETLFRTQHQLAYSAGAAAADDDPDIAAIIWGYEYVTVGDDRVRPNHRVLDGVKLPKNDPRWSRIRPPNGYSCRCQLLRVFDTDDHTQVEPVAVDFGDGEGPVAPEPDRGWAFNVGDVHRDLRRFERQGQAAARALVNKARAERALASAFPERLDGLEDLGPAGGSTGARVVADALGRRFVRKAGTSADHLREEASALAAYRAAGVAVPETRLYDDGAGRPVMLSQWVEGKRLGELTEAEREAVIPKIRDGFGVDAILANWDALGSDLDNIIVRPDGTPVRIDVGGSLRFRAQGGPKGAAFGGSPGEIFSMRDPKVNPGGHRAFGPMGFDTVVGSLDRALEREREVLAALPDGLRETVRARFAEAREIRDVSAPMLADRFKPEYVERVAFHTMGVRAAGVFEGVADRLVPGAGTGTLVDAAGVDWDNLRGEKSAAARAWAYLERVGVAGVVEDYLAAQRGNSWHPIPAAMKARWIQQRTVPASAYWTNPDAKPVLSVSYEGKAADALASMQALTMQTLRRVDLPNNDRGGGRVWLARTEHVNILRQYALKRGVAGQITRGAAESFSMQTEVTVSGEEATYQYLPHHRILTTYLWDKRNLSGYGPLYSDRENEAVAMAEGIPALWVGKAESWRTLRPAPGGAWP